MSAFECLQGVKLDLTPPPNNPLMAQPPADHVIGSASLLHYTWGAIFKDTKQNDAEVWKFDKRFHTARADALKVCSNSSVFSPISVSPICSMFVLLGLPKPCMTLLVGTVYTGAFKPSYTNSRLEVSNRHRVTIAHTTAEIYAQVGAVRSVMYIPDLHLRGEYTCGEYTYTFASTRL
jgi:hypothetical protein